jgi:hypothetical protein
VPRSPMPGKPPNRFPPLQRHRRQVPHRHHYITAGEPSHRGPPPRPVRRHNSRACAPSNVDSPSASSAHPHACDHTAARSNTSTETSKRTSTTATDPLVPTTACTECQIAPVPKLMTAAQIDRHSHSGGT